MGEHFKRAQDLEIGDCFLLRVRAHVVGVEHVAGATRLRCRVEIVDDGFDATAANGPLLLTFIVADVGHRH